jgi:hypothetical protein
MIAYQITKSKLESLIDAEAPGWRQRAALRTEGFRQKGRYEEDSSIWSEVKVVYMRLQGDCKCAYCERKLESIDFGKIEQDVEHFRPKGSVRAWKLPKAFKDQGPRKAVVIFFYRIIPLTTRPLASLAIRHSKKIIFRLQANTVSRETTPRNSPRKSHSSFVRSVILTTRQRI